MLRSGVLLYTAASEVAVSRKLWLTTTIVSIVALGAWTQRPEPAWTVSSANANPTGRAALHAIAGGDQVKGLVSSGASQLREVRGHVAPLSERCADHREL